MKYNHHKYTYTKPFDWSRHNWELVGPYGGISFHVQVPPENKEYSPTAGLEFHYSSPPEYMKDQAPSHKRCPVLDGPCWHDGTSLYATETLWPIIKAHLKFGDHQAIFRLLEREADCKFESKDDI
jgi:hypothetical protein